MQRCEFDPEGTRYCIMQPSRYFVAALGASLYVHASFAASFDCANATTSIEKQICADPVVSELDEHLGRYYEAARQRLERAGECLREDQRRWLREVRNACATAECLKEAYGLRLTELERFQPGANLVESHPLPDGPTLAWIFAPAEDEEALPNGSSRPFTIEGTYYDDPMHGPSLRTNEGDVYVLIPTMLYEGDPHGALARVESSATQIIVRGYLMDTPPDPSDYEDPSQTPKGFLDNTKCTYIYESGGPGNGL